MADVERQLRPALLKAQASEAGFQVETHPTSRGIFLESLALDSEPLATDRSHKSLSCYKWRREGEGWGARHWLSLRQFTNALLETHHFSWDLQQQTWNVKNGSQVVVFPVEHAKQTCGMQACILRVSLARIFAALLQAHTTLNRASDIGLGWEGCWH